jgi:hypothetical protein
MEMPPAFLEPFLLPDFEFLGLYSLGVLCLSWKMHQNHLRMENLPAFLEPFPVFPEPQILLQMEKPLVFLVQFPVWEEPQIQIQMENLPVCLH